MIPKVDISEWVNSAFCQYGGPSLSGEHWVCPTKLQRHVSEAFSALPLKWKKPKAAFEAAKAHDELIEALYTAFSTRGRRTDAARLCERLFGLWVLLEAKNTVEFRRMTSIWGVYRALDSQEEVITSYLKVVPSVAAQLKKLAPK